MFTKVIYHVTRLPLLEQLKYRLIICFQEGTKTVAFQHVLIHALSKLPQRTKWINLVLFETDLPLKTGHENKVRGTDKEYNIFQVYGLEIEDGITFKVTLLKACTFDYTVKTPEI